MERKKIKIFRQIKKNKKIEQFWVVDTETWGLGGKLAFGVLYKDDKNYYVFKTKQEFYKIIIDQNIKLVYAHNLDFDAIKIREKTSLEDVDNPLYAGGLLLTFKDKQGLQWRDSYCLLKSNASKLGNAIGYKKLPTPKKFIEPNKNKTITKTDIRYCKRDCKIIKHFLDTTFSLIGAQKYTIASSSMYIFRKKFLKNNLIVRPENENFKASYYGGRVECFKLGKVNAEVVDINSLYPFIMRKTDFPHPAFMQESENFTVNEFKTILQNFEGMAEVEIYHPKMKIGLLPYRNNGKLVFPYGLISGAYNFNELRFAVDHGCEIKRVYKVTYSTAKLKNFFTDFVNYFYNKKETTTGAEKLFNKFILNSLYGKFGENKHTERKYIHFDELNINIAKLEKSKDKYKVDELKRGYYMFDIERENKKPPIHQIYSICSYITSAARIYLNEHLIKYKDSIVYCDTDSMAIEGKYIGNIGNELGQWNFEDYKIEKIVGNKFYKTNKGLKAKGIPKKAVLKGREFHYSHFIKSRESLRRGIKAGTTVPMSKKISFDYDKRKAKRNGQTEILNVNELWKH